MAVVPSPKPYSMSDIKSKLMRPALTSHFSVNFNLPTSLVSWLNDKSKAFSDIPEATFDQELISISCCDATLPGSTLYTHDVTDYTGVMEKIPYRRVYDDRADFTFYVDHNYEIIKFFEFWIQYVVDEQYTKLDNKGLSDSTYSYRINYPDGNGSDKSGYRTEISIAKFERDYGGIQEDKTKQSKGLVYTYLNAYPISIMSMPVSYESSQLLKCTVSFSYSRYILTSNQIDKIGSPNPPQQNQSSQNTIQNFNEAAKKYTNPPGTIYGYDFEPWINLNQ